MLHSLLVSGCILPELTTELLVLILADACDHETFVVYNHRDMLAVESLMRLERLNTYAARFCV
jgi:hypothetical protein